MSIQDTTSDTLRAETSRASTCQRRRNPSLKDLHPAFLSCHCSAHPSICVFGVLARLGLVALMNYDGQAVFPLAYPQAVGCLVMGFGLGFKAQIGQMYVAALSL
jgi:hypothetical protein